MARGDMKVDVLSVSNEVEILNRKEFEARAVLYEIVNDVQYLLRLKQEFTESLSPYQIKTFWLNKKKIRQ